MMLPRVSIITSTYKRANLISRAIASVLAQDYPEWEMNIVGDCTPDNTAEVVASYRDARIRFYNLTEKSPPRAHGALAKNYAIQKMSSGQYIAYLDDDDCYKSNFLRVMTEYLGTHPDCRFVYCRCLYRDKGSGKRLWGNPLQRWMHGYSLKKLKRYNFIDTDCVMHERSLLGEVGYWDPHYYFDDYELWLRIARKTNPHYLNKILVEKFVDEPPFIRRAIQKGWRILRYGRRTPLE